MFLAIKKNFKILYKKLNEINFPLNYKKISFFESNRWDIETTDKKLIKSHQKLHKIFTELS